MCRVRAPDGFICARRRDFLRYYIFGSAVKVLGPKNVDVPPGDVPIDGQGPFHVYNRRGRGFATFLSILATAEAGDRSLLTNLCSSSPASITHPRLRSPGGLCLSPSSAKAPAAVSSCTKSSLCLLTLYSVWCRCEDGPPGPQFAMVPRLRFISRDAAEGATHPTADDTGLSNALADAEHQRARGPSREPGPRRVPQRLLVPRALQPGKRVHLRQEVVLGGRLLAK